MASLTFDTARTRNTGFAAYPKLLATFRCELRFSREPLRTAWLRRTVTLFGLLMLCSCSMSRDVEIARQAVEQFHRQVSEGQYDAIYDAADPVYKESLSREANHSFFSRIRLKMGAFQNTKNTGYFVSAATKGTFVRLQYKTLCLNGELDEQFILRIEGGCATLVRYEASSPLLSTD